MEYRLIGEHKYFPNCRFCFSKEVEKVIDMGIMPLAGGFLKSGDEKNEKLYPLQLHFCKKCCLLQVNTSVDPDILFKDYFYFSSSINTLVEHFDNIANEVVTNFKKPKNTFIVEIGANDGAFINALIKRGFKALGVDPAKNVVELAKKQKIPMINSYFTEKLAEKIVSQKGKADAIYSFHSMAHIEDMHDVMLGVKKLLKKNGYLAMEVHYLGSILSEMQYDMIYHEHQYYYSLLSLSNFLRTYNMEVFDIKMHSVRAGSITFYIQNSGANRSIGKEVQSFMLTERKLGYDKASTYKSFFNKMELIKSDLLKTLEKLKKQKKNIIGYGASGRGTIIANYSKIGKYLDYVVDDEPAKHGFIMPGTHNKIFPSKKMIKDKIDYALLFAWPFIYEVKKRNKDYKGKYIVPLPRVKVYDSK